MTDLPVPSGGMPDMSKLLEQAQAMQEQLLAGRADERFVGLAGGGAVRVEMSGAGTFEKVTIRPDAVDPDDVEMLEDLVLAAVRDASAQAQEAMQRSIGGALGGLFG